MIGKEKIGLGIAVAAIGGMFGVEIYETSHSKVDPVRVPKNARELDTPRTHSLAFLVPQNEIDLVDCGKVDRRWRNDYDNQKDLVVQEGGRVVVQCELSRHWDLSTPIERFQTALVPVKVDTP